MSSAVDTGIRQLATVTHVDLSPEGMDTNEPWLDARLHDGSVVAVECGRGELPDDLATGDRIVIESVRIQRARVWVYGHRWSKADE